MNKKIMIVEDDIAILEAMGMMLAEEGYEIATAPNGQVAVEQIRAFRPHLIFLDMLMSGVDGREICASIKADAATSNMKVVMISAYPDAEKFVFDYGADDFLAKPFEVSELYRMAEKYT